MDIMEAVLAVCVSFLLDGLLVCSSQGISPSRSEREENCMDKRKRNRYVGFCLTEEEWQNLDKKVKDMGMPKGRYLRNLAMGIVPRPLPQKEVMDILNQLRHIGNNINQMAMIANKSGSLDTVLFKANYEMIQMEIKKMMDLLAQPSYLKEDICQ